MSVVVRTPGCCCFPASVCKTIRTFSNIKYCWKHGKGQKVTTCGGQIGRQNERKLDDNTMRVSLPWTAKSKKYCRTLLFAGSFIMPMSCFCLPIKSVQMLVSLDAQAYWHTNRRHRGTQAKSFDHWMKPNWLRTARSQCRLYWICVVAFLWEAADVINDAIQS